MSKRLLFYFFFLSLSSCLFLVGGLYAQPDTLKISPSSGSVGSSKNLVPILLTNSVCVAGIQFTVGDEHGFLTVEQAEATTRTQGFSVSYSNNQVLVYDLGGGNIAPGNGPVLNLHIGVSENAAQEPSILAFVKGPILSDSQALLIEPVIAAPGAFTITDMMGVELQSFTVSALVVMPHEYALEQNYPNPFSGTNGSAQGNNTTKIGFSVKEPGRVTIRVFDLLGKEVARIVDRLYEQGRYSVDFTAKDLRSGVYIYKMEVNRFQVFLQGPIKS